MKKVLLSLLLISVAVISCNDDADDKPQATHAKETHGSCFIDITQTNNDIGTVITVVDTAFANDGSIARIITHVDTIPSLGSKTDTLETDQTYEDENGDEQYKDTIFTHPKKYELYINVSKG